MSLRMFSLALVALGVGCVNLDLDGEPQTSNVQQNFTECPTFMCGTNSPVIANFGFWELNLPPSLGVAGLPNNVGMQVVEFVQGSQAYLPRVVGGRLFAVSSSTTLAGAALTGGWFYLRNGSRIFKLQVTDVSSVDAWAVTTGGNHVMLETYSLDWTEFVNGSWGRFQNLCNNPPSRESPDLLTMTGANTYRTLLFEGDRILADKKLDTGVDTTWFNLGCAGSALAKMALTGHTEAAHVAGTFTTTLAERQTMLKMLAADYCGDGTAFTVAGQPLNWADDHNTMKFISLPAQLVLESRWTATGAACLNQPRVDVHPTTLSDQVFGPGVNIYNLVQSYCPAQMPPPCADASFALDSFHLLSATPM
jgi:hypothetical protein